MRPRRVGSGPAYAFDPDALHHRQAAARAHPQKIGATAGLNRAAVR